MKEWEKYCCLILILGCILGFIFCYAIVDKNRPKIINIIEKDVSLDNYYDIRLVNYLIENLTDVYKVEDDKRIIFMWVNKYYEDKYILRMVVMEK